MFQGGQAENKSISQQVNPAKKRSKGPVFWFFAFLIAFFIFSGKVLSGYGQTGGIFLNLPFFSPPEGIFNVPGNDAEVENNKQINVLFLGVGGVNHEGGDLTDTIMLAGLDTENKKAALLSIPRDLYVPIDGVGWRRINYVHVWGETQKKGSGGETAIKTIGKLLQVPIQYYVKVDFSGFEKIIDDLGGIKVYVDRDFVDYRYPVAGNEDDPVYDNRFEYLQFKQGWQEMDGALALKYARSRHGNNGEGTDFARARRQQKIIEAVKDKALSIQTLRPSVVSSILNDLNDHIETNLNTWEMIKFWTKFGNISNDSITMRVLDNSSNGLLSDMITADGAQVLMPRSGDFSEISRMANGLLKDEMEVKKEEETVAMEKPTVDIKNGTWISGFAGRTAQNLESFGFQVGGIGNFYRRDMTGSVIYDLTYGVKVDSLKVLKNLTEADVYMGLPQDIIDAMATESDQDGQSVVQPDFILVLGSDDGL